MFILAAGCLTPAKRVWGHPISSLFLGYLSNSDTTQTQQSVQPDEPGIDFQVNASIEYLNLKHFRNQEAKSLFIQALEKEKEAKAIEAESGALRVAYAEAKDDKKSELAGKILTMEQKLIELNATIPDLFGKARQLEAEIWSKASEAEVQKFQKEIVKYQDSLSHKQPNQQNSDKHQKNFTADTISYFPPNQKIAVKTEKSSPVVYKIQIGAYKGKIPDTATKLIKKLSVIRKIEDSKDEKGFIVYSTGNLKTYQEALTMQTQVKQEGVKNPVITAFMNGKKISVEEAKKINNEQ